MKATDHEHSTDERLVSAGVELIRRLIDDITCSPLDRRALNRLRAAVTCDVLPAVTAYERLLAATTRAPGAGRDQVSFAALGRVEAEIWRPT